MASNQIHLVEGRSNVVINFQYGTGTKRMELIDVGYVPTLSYNLISLAKIAKAGHKYSGDDPGLTVTLKSGEDILCPVVGDMYISYGRRLVQPRRLTSKHNLTHSRILRTFSSCIISCPTPARVGKKKTILPTAHTQSSGRALWSNSPNRAPTRSRHFWRVHTDI